MHAESMAAMTQLLTAYTLSNLHHGDRRQALDVGSYDVNGNYREMVTGLGYEYTGLDVREGPNVDIVTEAPYFFPLPHKSYQVVMAGNMLHNVAEPWKLIPEMARVLKPGGLLAIVTVWQWPPNRHPNDYYRFMPDGLKTLFDLTGMLGEYAIEALPDGTLAGKAIRL